MSTFWNNVSGENNLHTLSRIGKMLTMLDPRLHYFCEKQPSKLANLANTQHNCITHSQ